MLAIPSLLVEHFSLFDGLAVFAEVNDYTSILRFFTKEDNFWDLLFASLDNEAHLKKTNKKNETTLKEKKTREAHPFL